MSNHHHKHKHRHKHHSERWYRKRRFLLAVSVCIVVVLTLVCLFSMMKCAFDDQNGEVTAPIADVSASTIKYNGKTYVRKNNLETVLFMGLDKFEGEIKQDSYRNDQQADFLMLLVIDNENEKCSAIHINRDTMVLMDELGVSGTVVGKLEQQIALSHTYGDGGIESCNNTVDAASRVLKDEYINHFMSLTMDAVPRLNDLVGGVEVEVLEDFTGIDDSLIKGQTVTLYGDQALTYVRTRYGLEDSTNDTRMLRQQQYINAFIEKAQKCSLDNEEFVIELLRTIDECFVSDCNINSLESILNKIAEYEFMGILALEGESVKGDRYMEFRPAEDSVTEVIVNSFYKPKA